ncbi:hypothetical protein [Hymenobacter elongatus]|uniref:Uncharacterized protein n=1 Tax=Hymenobacter elongatus TaxID=877208 RepID=A0A4Z0PML9_9BACT|nr:hypothetical protein [Hymenobacter elongatus]TGE17194.1 hypothetical protein E5J99_07955 [Hymenobacter elongatus]
MENKQNQPASGANATGTSKSSNASNQSSTNPSAQGSSASQNTSAPAPSAKNPQDSQAKTPEPATNRTSASMTPGQDSQASQRREESSNKQQSGQSWMNISSWLDGSKEIPQSVKDFGTKALDQVNKLSTTQKVVGGALLLGGIGWLSTRSGANSSKASQRGGYRSASDLDSDYRVGKTYGAGKKDYLTNYGSAGRSSDASRTDKPDYSGSSSSSDYRSSSAGKDTSAGYRSSSANTSASSSLGDDDYSGNL